jgi:hypothetical protein
MLVFSYQPEPLSGPAPPSMPASATLRWRPLIPVILLDSTGLPLNFSRAVVDPAADDTVFPVGALSQLSLKVRADTGHRVRWRGQPFALQFADVEIALTNGIDVWTWPAVVAFSPAPLPYPILGRSGCLEFFDVRFRGERQIVELETNAAYRGTKS